jgi:hypothetical protein
MSCTRFGPALAAHAAGGELDPAAGRHLGECAACRRMLDTQVQLLTELDAELGRTLSMSASPDFAARVVRQARGAGEARARWIPAPVWAGLGMAVVMVIMVAAWIPRAPVAGTAAIPPKTEAPRPQAEDVVLKAESPQVPKASPSGASLAATRRNTAHPPDHKRVVSAEPPVIVEPSRALAIQRLRELMIDGRLDEKMLPPAVRAEAVLTELSIAPLEIPDIRVRDVEIVGRPPAAIQRQ